MMALPVLPQGDRDEHRARAPFVRWVVIAIVLLVVAFIVYSLVIFIFFPVKFWGGL
jgi:hypothetical protein